MAPDAKKHGESQDAFHGKCQALMDFVVKVNDEDVVAIENLQKGLANARSQNLHGEFIPKFDWPIHRFQNMVLNGLHGTLLDDNLMPPLTNEFEQHVLSASA